MRCIFFAHLFGSPDHSVFLENITTPVQPPVSGFKNSVSLTSFKTKRFAISNKTHIFVMNLKIKEMRKLFFTIAVLLCSVNVFGQYSYKDYFLNNIIVTDICFPTFGFGTTHEDATFYVGFEFTFFNAILGFGWDNEIVESEHWTKDVYVRPYTRVQNGKVVHVKGYYRARPNKKNDTSLSCCGNNIYTGYWFPCRTPEFTYIMDSKMWIAPIIGSTNEREDEFLWGLAFKFSGNYSYSRLGISVTFTNTFVSMGVSFCYH